MVVEEEKEEEDEWWTRKSFTQRRTGAGSSELFRMGCDISPLQQ